MINKKDRLLKSLITIYILIIGLCFFLMLSDFIRAIIERENNHSLVLETFSKEHGMIFLLFLPLTIFEIVFIPLYLKKPRFGWKTFFVGFSLIKLSLIVVWEVIYDIPHIIEIFRTNLTAFFIIMLVAKAFVLLLILVSVIFEIIVIFSNLKIELHIEEKTLKITFILSMIVFGFHIISIAIWVMTGAIHNTFDYENAVNIAVFHSVPRIILFGSLLLGTCFFKLFKNKRSSIIACSLSVILGLIIYLARVLVVDTINWFGTAVMIHLPFTSWMVTLLIFTAIISIITIYFVLSRLLTSLKIANTNSES